VSHATDGLSGDIQILAPDAFVDVMHRVRYCESNTYLANDRRLK
jgi:hypothetical protein